MPTPHQSAAPLANAGGGHGCGIATGRAGAAYVRWGPRIGPQRMSSPSAVVPGNERVALGGIFEVDEHPGRRRVRSLKRFEAVVAVLEEQLPVAVLGEQRRRLPAVVEALLHLPDVVLPSFGRDGDERVSLGPREAHQLVEGHADRADPPVTALREPGGQRRVAAPRARQEVADPERGLVARGGRTGRREVEALLPAGHGPTAPAAAVGTVVTLGGAV